MVASNTHCDILVIGAGPAGCAAARLLADWGHQVLVIDRPAGDAGRLAESIPPSADRLLRAIGALDAVRAAGFMPWRGNTVWWADEPARVETFAADASGYQVLRSELARLLRSLARDAGARVEEGRVNGKDDHHARFVIDASGRAGVLARDGWRVPDPAGRTVALAGTWRNDGPWPVEDDSHTLVASYAGGWAWSVPVGPALRQFTVMVDPARSGLVRDAPSREIYLAEIGKVAAFTRILAKAQLIEQPWGADASEYTARQYAGPGFLLAGDAGSAINPLSSFGVKKALASGWLAAIVAHTVLVNPVMINDAVAFFDRRERTVAAAAARQASRFAIEAAARTGHPFWLTRAAAMEFSRFNSEPDAAELARDPGVVAAFTDLRNRSSIRLNVGTDVRIEPRAAVRGREIVMEEHLINPSWPEGLRYLRGVDLVTLLRLAPRYSDVGEMFEANRPAAPAVELPDFLGALSVLVAKGALRHM